MQALVCKNGTSILLSKAREFSENFLWKQKNLYTKINTKKFF